MKYSLTAAAFLCASASLAGAASFDEIFAFGDSLNDCCVNPQAPFTNGPDSWLVEFAGLIGANYTDNPTTNYATGGAQSGALNAISGGGVAQLNGLQSQINQFKIDAPAIGSDDLAVIWVGTNDIWPSSYEGDTLFGLPNLDIVKPLGLNPAPIDLAGYVSANIQTAVRHLRNGGFEQVLLLTPYDIGDSALFDVPGGPAQNTAYSEALRDALLALYTPGIDTYVLDVVALIRELQAGSPGNGFVELTTDPSCTFGPIVCEDRSEAEQDGFIYLDIVHFTTATNSAVAGAAAGTLLEGAPVAPVPLPAGGLLLLAAAGGLLLLRRRA